MEKTFQCKILTPIFLAGADGETPELRSPSLKASMRFWFRAIHPNLSLTQLLKREVEIFGGSYTEDKEKKSLKSSFILVTEDLSLIEGKRNRLPGKDKNPASAQCFVSGEFNIIIKTQEAFLKSRSVNSEYIYNILKLSVILGDLGKRSRRGFGAYHIIGETDPLMKDIFNLINIINPNIYSFNTNNNIIEIISSQVKNIDYPYLKKVEIGKKSETADALTENIYQASHKNSSDSLGFANKSGRLASPIYVSAVKSGINVNPIISTLNTVPIKHENVNTQQKFKGDIL